MKGWVGLVGWPVADGLPTLVVTHQLQVERRTGKVRRPETDVLPLCHATNYRTEWTFITIVGVVIIFFNYWRRSTYWYGPSYARARIVADAGMAYNSVLVFRRFSGISAIRPCRRACQNAASWSEIVSVTRPVNTRRLGTPRPANGSRENRRYDHLPQRADAHGYDGAARQRTSIIRLRV